MNNFGVPGMIPGQMMSLGFPNQVQPGQNSNGLTINGDFDLTIVNHRDFGSGGLGANGLAAIMSQQMMQMQQLMIASRQSDMARLEASKELLALEMKKDVINNLLSSSVSDEFKSKLLAMAMKTEEVGDGDEINRVLIENKSQEDSETKGKMVWGKAAAETIDVEIVKDCEADRQSSTENKTNPYTQYFAREDLKRDIHKYLLEQMDADKAGELPTAFVTPMRERMGLRFDIAHVLKTKTSAWRKSIRKAISNQPGKSHIVVKGEYPTQDYLVLIYDVIGKPCECVYVSAIPLHRYYAASEVEKEFEDRLREIAAINLLLKEEFPHISSFTHIIEPVIHTKAMTVYIKNVESNDSSEFDMDRVSTVSINGTTEPQVQISLEMYSRAIRKYKVN